MSFDEQPDGDIHGECVLEIHKQAERIAELEAEILNKEGMALVTKEDAENYCRILSLLGMEEEGSPIEGVEHLISLRDGMTCGDCNDTGWLENREEGRYPCTCMTEAEPYQILQAKCAELRVEAAFNFQQYQDLGEASHHADTLQEARFNQLCQDMDRMTAQRDILQSRIDTTRKFLEFLWRDAQLNDYTFGRLEEILATLNLAAMN